MINNKPIPISIYEPKNNHFYFNTLLLFCINKLITINYYEAIKSKFNSCPEAINNIYLMFNNISLKKKTERMLGVCRGCSICVRYVCTIWYLVKRIKWKINFFFLSKIAFIRSVQKWLIFIVIIYELIDKIYGFLKTLICSKYLLVWSLISFKWLLTI